MTTEPRYSVDTSILITAWRDLYPIDLFPSLWEEFARLIENREALISDEVYLEIGGRDDGLHEWATPYKDAFEPLSDDVQTATTEVLSEFPRLVNTAKFRDRADPFVIAVARVHETCVVTNEGTGSERKPHIPDVCSYFGIRCINLLQFLREQGWVFR